MLKKLFSNSILSRLFISFLLVISPILVIGIFMFSWEKQEIKSEIENSAISNVSFLKTNLETEVQNIKLLQFNLMNDSSLKKLITEYSFLPNYEYYTLINDVQQRLLVMKNSNLYIEDVILYVPGIDHTISAASGYLDFVQREYEHLLNINYQSKYPMLVDEANIYAVMIYPTYTMAGKPPLYLVEVKLSQDEIRASLSKFSENNSSDTALYDYTSGRWLFSHHGSLEGKPDSELGIIAASAGKSFNSVATIGGERYYVISSFSKYLNSSFVQYVPIGEIFRIPDRYGYFLWLYAALSVIIILAYSYSTYKFVKYPINKIIRSFRHLEEGDLSVRVQMKAANEFNYLFESFNKMVSRLNELIDRVYKQELFARKSELKQLQSQINPHFLYNSYFMLHRMIKDGDSSNAEMLSSYLGRYFQFITRNALEEVTLTQEAEHARSYALIQQMRFAGRLTVEFGDIPEKYKDILVPRMILQPILENSLEHGLKSTVKNGIARIIFEDAGGGLNIIVEDSGGDLPDAEIAHMQKCLSSAGNDVETTGMINVHRRIALNFGAGSGISVSRSGLGGLRVEITIAAIANSG
jgi:two-component system sensor histidine kinase YesM